MNRTSSLQMHASAAVRRLVAAAAAAFAVLVLASTRAAALVPPPDDPSSGHAGVPAPVPADGSDGSLLWIALALAITALLVAGLAFAGHRRNRTRHIAGAVATA
jgi:hypothetical protein